MTKVTAFTPGVSKEGLIKDTQPVNLHYQPETRVRWRTEQNKYVQYSTVQYTMYSTVQPELARLTCSSCAKLTNIGTRSDFKYSTSTTLAKSPSFPLAALQQKVSDLRLSLPKLPADHGSIVLTEVPEHSAQL